MILDCTTQSDLDQSQNFRQRMNSESDIVYNKGHLDPNISGK